MGAASIYAKTPLGVQEVTSRKMKLAPRLRTMLILIDGQQPAFILQEEAAKIGAPDDFLGQLESLQLVEVAGTATVETATAKAASAGAGPQDEFGRFRQAKDFMNVTIVTALGLKSFFFTLKLEKASSRADLRELAESYRAAIAKSSSDEEAEVLASRLADMLA